VNAGALPENRAVTSPQPIDQVLESVQRRLPRLTPAQAKAAWRDGAVLVDIRPEAQRASEGQLPGALIIERNVLEWRFDPTSDAQLPIADYELSIIVICQEGYASSLAAASLQDVSYAAWRELL
jgi:rhodanese-related sulfurtransferase